MKKSIFTALILTSTVLWAEVQDENKINAEATKNTQTLLRDKALREKEVFATDHKAKQADDQISQITGGDETAKEEMYDISAELTPWIVEQAAGDPEKMNTMMDQALKNPQKFLDSMPAEQKARIKGLSQKMQKSKIKP